MAATVLVVSSTCTVGAATVIEVAEASVGDGEAVEKPIFPQF